MARHKIVTLGVDAVVREGLADGKTQAQILEDVNTELVVRHDKKKGKPPSVSIAALERFLASIPEQAVAALHGGKLATANAELALDFGERFRQRMVVLDAWLEEVGNANRYVTVNGQQVDLGPDWQARKAMMSEERRWLQLYADLMERIYNAELVRTFQSAVIEALRDETPEVARKVEQVLQNATQSRARHLLGDG